MFCGKCGMENADGAKFCKSCGQELKGSANHEGAGNLSTASKENVVEKSTVTTVNQLLGKIKSLPKKVLVGTVGVVLALIVIICIAVSAGSTINLDKYVTIEASGYEGYGRVTAVIDWDAIEEKYGDKLSYTSKAQEEYGGFLSYMTPIDVLKDAVSVEFSEQDYLSNGDKVEYTWDIEEDLNLYLDCKIKSKGGTYEVTALEEIGTFDAFADLEVYFEGIGPNGRVNYNYSGEQLGYYDFSCSQTDGLSNGDKVTISIAETDMEYFAERFGMIPSKMENEYVVSGLQEYVSSYADLSTDFIETIKSEAEDAIYANSANNYASTSTLSDLKYEGYIYTHISDANSYYNYYNNIYLIYSGTVSNTDNKFPATTVYFPVGFSNILSSDGNITYEKNRGIYGSTYLGDTYYSTAGYSNPLACYVELAEENADTYVAEAGDGFETYSQYQMVSSINDISSEYKTVLQNDAIARINEYIANNYNGGSAASDLAYVGEYLLVAKNQGTNLANNVKYVVVCSATVSNSNGRFDTTTVYFPVEYDGIVKLPGDEYIYTSVKGILGSSTLPNSWYSTKGYIDGTVMFSKIVTANREDYKYEVSETLKMFGE